MVKSHATTVIILHTSPQVLMNKLSSYRRFSSGQNTSKSAGNCCEDVLVRF